MYHCMVRAKDTKLWGGSMNLERPNLTHQEQYNEMMQEWIEDGGRLHPAALSNNGVPYEKWLQWMKDDENVETCPEGSPPQTLYFCFDNGILVGAVTIRHFLNERTVIAGGHVGIGIRPTKRRTGYATQALGLAIQKLYAMGIDDILLTCAEGNIGSEKTMLKYGAIFENLVDVDGERQKRFWLRRTK